MKSSDTISIVEYIRSAKTTDLLLISIFILPAFLGGWTFILNQIRTGFVKENPDSIWVMISFYFIALAIMKWGQSKEQKSKIAAIRIQNFLRSKDWTMMSFDRISKRIDSEYDTEFLKRIIQKYPEDFRIGKVKGGKVAIVLLGQEKEDRINESEPAMPP